jgi:hypothetical protein
MKIKLVLILLGLCLTTLVFGQVPIEQWKRFELKLTHSSVSNPFDIQLSASFQHKGLKKTVQGFYDGHGVFKIRFMPDLTGSWTYETKSNVKSLSGLKGKFTCKPAGKGNHGMVSVHKKVHFNYSDGTSYFPFGTTAYAWTHMGNELQEMSLHSFKSGGFNKVRMCVFPKNYELVKEEPTLFPYLIKGHIGGKIIWDFERFNPLFFSHLEKRIEELDQLGIQADLILFHPYDKGRWGFDEMPKEANEKYIRYISARLSSFKNIWWSMANEWDYVKSKSLMDWQNLIKLLVKLDVNRHLCSIHGSTAMYFPYWDANISHASIQDEAPVQSPASAALLRNIYQKPIVLDEVGYEGNLRSRWGRYSPEKMTELIWNGVVGGTYVTHGESYMFKDATDTIFWAKGGHFKGESWKRVKFLRKIIESLPRPISMADVSRDFLTAISGNWDYLIYFGERKLQDWTFNLPHGNGAFGKLPAGIKFRVQLIDTWNMTIEELPLTFESGLVQDYRVYDIRNQIVQLKNRSYMALRIYQIKR